MIPTDCILGGQEGLELEDVEHWLFRFFWIFRSDLPGWGPKNLNCIYLPPEYSQVCCPSIWNLKNFPFFDTFAFNFVLCTLSMLTSPKMET